MYVSLSAASDTSRLKVFRITSQHELFAKYVAQGCWTRCLRCQKDVGSIFEHSIVGYMSHSVGTDTIDGSLSRCAEILCRSAERIAMVCKPCHEKGTEKPWIDQLACRGHGCVMRRRVYPEAECSTEAS